MAKKSRPGLTVGPYTARQVAEKIKRDGETLQTAIDRLRNWTKEGLIKPIGEKNPGTGRVRLYDTNAVVNSALLQALVDGTGSSAVAASSVLTDAQRAFATLLNTNDNKGFRDTFLIIARSGQEKSSISYAKLSQLPEALRETGEFDTYTLVDLHRLFMNLNLG